MPWRPDPGVNEPWYHTLVSEAMLQQTQVATVIPYFERFMAAFPTIQTLAEADEAEVLNLWQGLGYYRRARNLHAAAKKIVEDHAGKLPADIQAIRELPGVGEYTAGAIASIAFGLNEPLVDGNVARVFARWFNLHEPVDAPATKKQLWQIAQQWIAKQKSNTRHPGDLNQSLMELGATVCTPKSPKCLMCPVRDHCQAHASGTVDQLPKTLPKRKPTQVIHQVFAIHRNGQFFLRQRPDTGLWSNMWELPTHELNPSNKAKQRKTKQNITKQSSPPDPTWLHQTFNLKITSPELVSHFKHQTTHRTIRFELYLAQVESGRLKKQTTPTCWRKLDHPDRVNDLPLSNPQREIIQRISQYLAEL